MHVSIHLMWHFWCKILGSKHSPKIQPTPTHYLHHGGINHIPFRWWLQKSSSEVMDSCARLSDVTTSPVGRGVLLSMLTPRTAIRLTIYKNRMVKHGHTRCSFEAHAPWHLTIQILIHLIRIQVINRSISWPGSYMRTTLTSARLGMCKRSIICLVGCTYLVAWIV